MEMNAYEYNRTQPWAPQQNQLYPNKPMAENEQQLIQSQNQKMPQRNVGQKPGTQVKMPKARALALANTLKRTLAVASIIGFGMFGGLVAMHQVGTTTTQSKQSTSGSSTTSSNSNSSSQNSNNFLNQQGGNTSGTSSTSSNSTSSTPVTGTSTS
jgi:cytoskeletal protein RodZ